MKLIYIKKKSKIRFSLEKFSFKFQIYLLIASGFKFLNILYIYKNLRSTYLDLVHKNVRESLKDLYISCVKSYYSFQSWYSIFWCVSEFYKQFKMSLKIYLNLNLKKKTKIENCTQNFLIQFIYSLFLILG